MVGRVSFGAFDIADAMSACRNLKPTRWAAAGLCVLLGLASAVLLETHNAAKVVPAQVVALSATGAVAPAEAVAQMRRTVLTSASLLKTSTDLNLAESGLFGDSKAEDFLARSITIAPSERASVIDISVASGTPAFDALIANYVARSVVAQPPAQSTAAAAAPARFTLVAKARVVPAASVIIYQLEVVVLALLLAAAIIAQGVARALRRKATTAELPAWQAAPARPAAIVPRGILEQIDMLERMWPETGRQNALPEGSNDEPEQVELKPARDIVVRMAELRLDARKAMQQPTEEALEDVLTDMQSLRDQVRWITAEQLRRRRKVNGFGR